MAEKSSAKSGGPQLPQSTVRTVVPGDRIQVQGNASKSS